MYNQKFACASQCVTRILFRLIQDIHSVNRRFLLVFKISSGICSRIPIILQGITNSRLSGFPIRKASLSRSSGLDRRCYEDKLVAECNANFEFFLVSSVMPEVHVIFCLPR